MLARKDPALPSNSPGEHCSPLHPLTHWSRREGGLTPPRNLAIIATLFVDCVFKIICRGRRPRRPVQPCATTQLQGGVKTPPYGATTNNHQTICAAATYVPTGRRGRRPLRPTQKPQQTIEVSHLPIVECWPRAGASPSALGFLRARLRSVRAKREPKRP